ncbi:type II toxin-antitoxin system RelE/ParE family toxin [Hellea balneolensis]|uniref:type II toxin-antitoxin system RelE/ParE family toxin n=1 Tax=Hellea balneolensis TaxID=287478 RepID=UPI00040FCF81|nr:type II toxin-antitoxin system RelE/ParE family toxin [Hellea balneolensis]
MASYRLAPNATADLERIWLYGFERWGLEAAVKYNDDLFMHFEELSRNPELYPVISERKNYRRSLCGKESVYYRVADDCVEIMAIIGRQDVGKWLR